MHLWLEAGRSLELLAGRRKSAIAVWARRGTATATSTKLCCIEIKEARASIESKAGMLSIMLENTEETCSDTQTDTSFSGLSRS